MFKIDDYSPEHQTLIINAAVKVLEKWGDGIKAESKKRKSKKSLKANPNQIPIT